MKITLDNQELNQAVVAYLKQSGLNVDLDKASIDITDDGVVIDTNGGNTPKKPKNKVKAVDTTPTKETETEVVTEPVIEDETELADTDDNDIVINESKPKSMFMINTQETSPPPTNNEVNQVRKLFQ